MKRPHTSYFTSILFVFITAIAIALAFQNCSGVEFSSVPEKTHNIVRLGDGTYVETFSHKNDVNTTVDILFVLDDSCSMSSIITNVKNGVASLQNVPFAQDTRMAVTYMSPVMLGSDGVSPNFTNPYYAAALGTPGHMQLVSKPSIDSYLTSRPADKFTANFESLGCMDSWFAPSQVNANGQACIVSAMQAPFYCTGVEAGVTSYEQLLYRYQTAGLKLFRDNASTNIIFISDTHDPGASFYGLSNAPARMKNYSELLNLTLTNNPKIRSLKMSGVVPLPVVGDAKLDNVKVVGGTPQSSTDANVGSGEGTHNYAYLDYIKASQGVAIHAKRDNWADAMGELIKVSSTVSGPRPFRLAHIVTAILSVKVNGTPLNSDEFALQPDGQTLLILADLDKLTTNEIKINYSAQ